MPQLTWLVTGCSSGFGEHFTYSILARGDHVIATARGAAGRLQHLKDAGATILELDVTAPQSELDIIVEDALKFYGGIDVLVNNAGYLEAGLVEDVSYERLIAQCNTNLFGAINITRSILPHFRQKRAGKNVFIGSTGGWCGVLGGGAYCMSKFALEGVVECLQKETAHLGIQTIIIEPGYYKTNVFGSNVKENVPAVPENTENFTAVKAAVAKVDGHQRGDPKKAVERIIDVVKSEGMAAGRTMPERLPLGPDALLQVRNKCHATLKLCDDWENLIASTDWVEDFSSTQLAVPVVAVPALNGQKSDLITPMTVSKTLGTASLERPAVQPPGLLVNGSG